MKVIKYVKVVFFSKNMFASTGSSFKVETYYLLRDVQLLVSLLVYAIVRQYAYHLKKHWFYI
jgi:hypothetical protein